MSNIPLLLFLWKKSNQKNHPKTITSRFRPPTGGLIKRLYYCDLNFCFRLYKNIFIRITLF